MEVVKKPNTPQIPIVLDPSSHYDWQRLILKRLLRGQMQFESYYSYLCPSSASGWVRRSARNIAAPTVQPGFYSAVTTVFGALLKTSSLTLVDLGVGDMVRSQPVVAMAAESGILRRLILVDINLDLLRRVISPDVPEIVRSTIEPLAAHHVVTALSCDYRLLRRHKELLMTTDSTCLLMLGNTLGIERQPTRILNRLRQALRPGDRIFLELQAREAEGLTDLELTAHFQKDFDFYAAPLLALGVSSDQMDVTARTTRRSGTEIISVDIAVHSEYVLSEKVTLRRGTYSFMSIRKFTKDEIGRMLREAGFVIDQLVCSEPGKNPSMTRPFYYVNACALH